MDFLSLFCGCIVVVLVTILIVSFVGACGTYVVVEVEFVTEEEVVDGKERLIGKRKPAVQRLIRQQLRDVEIHVIDMPIPLIEVLFRGYGFERSTG